LKNHVQVERLTETVNRFIAAILPIALIGRDLPPTAGLSAADLFKTTSIDLEDRLLRRCWDALQFATDNLPDPQPMQPILFDDTTNRILRSYGLDRADRAAQVYYLAQVVATQERQLRSWEAQEAAREADDLAQEAGQ
jgi:hypothetical protein